MAPTRRRKGSKNRTYVYVDGFNLYYGSLKNTPYKWVNLEALCQNLLPKDKILKIRYFTAHVSGRPNDPNIPGRQKIYLRALRTLKTVSLHFGHYLSSVKWAPLAAPKKGEPEMAKILRTEEKGTDVNIATHLLVDAFEDQYETAIIISNDSDLEEPLRVVRQKFKKTVGIINPQRHNPLAAKLANVATFRKRIGPTVLQVCQFPSQLKDAKGMFHKPPSW